MMASFNLISNSLNEGGDDDEARLMFAPAGYKTSNQDHEKRYVGNCTLRCFSYNSNFVKTTHVHTFKLYEPNPKAFLCWTSLEGAPTLSNQDHEERYVCTMPYNLELEQLLIFTRHNLLRT